MIALLEKTFFPLLSRLGEAKHLRAIRDGIVAILPLIITGSFFLLIAQLPGSEPQAQWGPVEIALSHSSLSGGIFQWYVAHHDIFLIPYLLTMKLMALYAAFTISASLARLYSEVSEANCRSRAVSERTKNTPPKAVYALDPVTGGLMSMACMLITVVPINVNGEWMIPVKQFGGTGLFLAILVGFASAEVYRLWEKLDLLKLPQGVPPAVTRAFSSVVPMAALVTVVWILRHLLHIDLQSLIQNALHPIEKLGDSLAAVIVITLLIHLIWIAGVHGVSVMNAVFLALWINYLEKNAQAVISGNPAPYVTAHPFYQWFVWIGGSGATLGLMLLMLTSKSKSLKSLGKLSLLPSLCNINEPIIFGLPIMLNPIMAVPFLLAPTTAGTLAYLAMKYDFVRKPYVWVPWTLPAPIGAYLSTGYDGRALVLFGIIFAVTTIIYFPFFKQLEKKQHEKE